MTEKQQLATIPPRSPVVSAVAGGLVLGNLADVRDFSKDMAASGVAVPKHLRGNPGACFSVILQAVEWRMSPFAVANKSYSVNDRLAYEAQLLAAVILQRAPLRGRPKYEYTGSGPDLQCRVSVKTTDDEVVDYTSPKVRDIAVKNSPLWKGDPEQQLGYYSIRALARRHFPDVILGVYAADEVPHEPAPPRDITPTKQPVTIAAKLDAIAARKQPEAVFEADLTPAERAALAEFAAPEDDDAIEEGPNLVAELASRREHENAAGLAPGEIIDPETGEIVHGVDDPVELYAEPDPLGEGAFTKPTEPPKPDPKALYLEAIEAILDGAKDAEQLAKWWSVPKNRGQRALWLTVEEANELKARVTARVQALKAAVPGVEVPF